MGSTHDLPVRTLKPVVFHMFPQPRNREVIGDLAHIRGRLSNVYANDEELGVVQSTVLYLEPSLHRDSCQPLMPRWFFLLIFNLNLVYRVLSTERAMMSSMTYTLSASKNDSVKNPASVVSRRLKQWLLEPLLVLYLFGESDIPAAAIPSVSASCTGHISWKLAFDTRGNMANQSGHIDDCCHCPGWSTNSPSSIDRLPLEPVASPRVSSKSKHDQLVKIVSDRAQRSKTRLMG